MASLRLTQRQWRIYLTVWLVILAALTGTLIGVLVPRLFIRNPSPSLGGGIVINAHSVQAPDFTLRDQSGATVSLAGLRGSVIALTFLDTQCLNLCPLQASLLGTVQTDLGSRTPFSVVVVSVKPAADTPSAIATFATAHGLGGHLFWLNGTPSQLANVWNSYGVAVQVANGDLAHSSVIYLIDRSGFERVGFADVPDPAAVESDIRILAGS
ncbi:MAG TPA: SCO family protein [Candidatus Acidoferrum sp.]|jgi:cytochrome oxidase Cu insertion factor (SCO1/SenC/PrrC family)|nr:SCO family protein [Candidatus Acidoferrum sp.]